MEEAVRVTTDYVRQRSAFGKPIAEFQNTQFKLAECKTQAVVVRVFIDEMMVRLLAGELDAATAAMAKYWTRSEEHTSELQSLMRISYAVFCLKKKKIKKNTEHI